VIAEEVGLTLEKATLKISAKPSASKSARKTPPSSTAPALPTNIEARVKQIRARSRKPPATTTRKSCRSAWPSWPAVLP
jgi:hypothetical protein